MTKKIFYGWWIVVAGAVLNFLVGGTLIYGFTVFFNPIRQTFNWGAAVTSVAFSIRGLETGFLDPVVGMLVDKLGPRKLMLPGWAMAAVGFLLMSRINSLWTFYAAFLLVATGLGFGSFVPINTAVAHWFNKKRSRAMALLYVGFGASGLLAPVLALSISEFGWRTSLLIIGVIFLLIGIPLSLLMRHKPSSYGYVPDGDKANELEHHSLSKVATRVPGHPEANFKTRAALRTRAFWLLSAVFFFQHIATSAVMVHIVPSLESVEVSTTIAAATVTGMTVCSLIGRLGFGFLGDFTNKRYLIAIALAFQTIGLFIFSFVDASRMWLVIPFLLTYGPGYGGPIPLRPALQADYFGTRSFGTIMGWMALISMLGGIASPVVAGWIFDAMGGYSSAWQLFALTTLPGIPLILMAKPPRTTE